MISLEGFSPCDLGLPEQFDEFRPEQIEAIDWITHSMKRGNLGCLPTGSGKSLVALALARTLGVRTAILTSTKGLMEQYVADAGDLVYPIKGKGNYTCAYKPTTCRLGKHEGCRLASNGSGAGLGCTYESERYRAKQAKVVVTNYAFWIRINERARGLVNGEKEGEPNPFKLLILDEAHHAGEELSKALQVKMVETSLRAAKITGVPRTDDIRELVGWAQGAVVQAEEILKQASVRLQLAPSGENRQRVSELDGLVEALGKIGQMQPGYWVCELTQGTQWGRVWTFDCVWPGALGESRLLLGIPKIVMLSATLRPASARMIGLKPEEFEFREWPRVFPAESTKVYVHVSKSRTRKDKSGAPAAIGLNYHTTKEDWDEVIKDVDEFIGYWKGMRGLVHTGSYERQKMMMERSRWKEYMIGNTQDPESESAMQVAEKWRKQEPPSILVSPSFSTGWDFPGGGWIVFLKVPLRPSTGKVTKARLERMPNYLDYQAMQDLVQGAGRLTRRKEDRTVVLIKDNNIWWFMNRNKGLKPGYFQLREVERIPRP